MIQTINAKGLLYKQKTSSESANQVGEPEGTSGNRAEPGGTRGSQREPGDTMGNQRAPGGTSGNQGVQPRRSNGKPDRANNKMLRTVKLC